MKISNIPYLLILVTIIFSCAKKEDDSQTTVKYITKLNSVSPLGSISVGNDSLEGSYASTCLNFSDTAWSSIGQYFTVTGNTSVNFTYNYYSDASCGTPTGYISYYLDNVTIGNLVNENYQVDVTQTKFTFKPYDNSFKSYVDTNYFLTTTVGEEYDMIYGLPGKSLIKTTSTSVKFGNLLPSSYPTENSGVELIKQ